MTREDAEPDAREAPPRFLAYARVSTKRQDEKQLSVPDQLAQMHVHASSCNGEIVGEYREARTATDDKRQEFQAMIERACGGERIDGILVHSFSRFMREAHLFEFYARKLADKGVRIISITQSTGPDDEPLAKLARAIMTLFDEYQSAETSKHVTRSMKKNAEDGFWNGAPVPLGYKLVTVEVRGNRAKRKLAVDEVDKEQVCLIFSMYLYGKDGAGAMGVKTLVSWLNAHGYRTATGAFWGTGSLHKVLTNETYVGCCWFNRRCAKTGRVKKKSEHVRIECPPIIDQQIFDEVQRTLAARNPKIAAPRETTGPILLTGLTVHAVCNGAMTLRTGTSRSGVVHRYYSCSTCGRQGKMVCEGLAVPMSKLDDLVTEHLCEKLLEPSRLALLLSGAAERRRAKAANVCGRVQKLQEQLTAAKDRLRRLYRLVEDDEAEIDEVLQSRLADLRSERDKAQVAIDRAQAEAAPFITIDPEMIEAFGNTMRARLTAGDIAFRKAYLRTVVSRIEVDRHLIRIFGQRDRIEHLVRSGVGETAKSGSQMRTEWRAP